MLRAVPKQYVAVEPAAALSDAAAAIKDHNPRILLFSGHSFMGSLAFELPDGRIDLPPPSEFISLLHTDHTRRLQCIFLNGCRTADLGYQIAEKMDGVRVICWSTITEDSAARAFAQGFYDAIGAYVTDGEPAQIETAFWVGIRRFRSEGFYLGDPAVFLHPPHHPHHYRPDRLCENCFPSVHGSVVLFKKHQGRVVRMRMGMKDKDIAHGDCVGLDDQWIPVTRETVLDNSFISHFNSRSGEDTPQPSRGRRSVLSSVPSPSMPAAASSPPETSVSLLRLEGMLSF